MNVTIFLAGVILILGSLLAARYRSAADVQWGRARGRRTASVRRDPAQCPRREARGARMPNASEKVGNCAIVSLRTASGISARIASTAWWIHSPASGATAQAPTSTSRSRSTTTPKVPVGSSLVGVRPGDRGRQVDRRRDDVDPLLAGLRLGQADGGDLGVGEEHARHGAVVGLRRRAPRMSAHAMRAWYLATCVNSATPVTSPIAQTPSPARQRSSTSMPRGPGSMPTVSSPRSCVRGRRPTATTSTSPRDLGCRRRARRRARRRRAAPPRPSPAERELDAVVLEDLAPGSSPIARLLAVGERSAPWTIVTVQPNRARNCASSTATTPPPMNDCARWELRQRRRLAVRPVARPPRGRGSAGSRPRRRSRR